MRIHGHSHQRQASDGSCDMYVALHDQKRLVGNRLRAVVHQTAEVGIEIGQSLHLPGLGGA